jgi:hypothetical protein
LCRGGLAKSSPGSLISRFRGNSHVLDKRILGIHEGSEKVLGACPGDGVGTLAFLVVVAWSRSFSALLALSLMVILLTNGAYGVYQIAQRWEFSIFPPHQR